jgi:hypothetical protein
VPKSGLFATGTGLSRGQNTMFITEFGAEQASETGNYFGVWLVYDDNP